MTRVAQGDPPDTWLAAALRSRGEDAHPRDDCPHPERLWDAARLQVPVEERLEVIDHVSECPTCAEAWTLAAEIEMPHDMLDQSHVAGLAPASDYGRNALLIAAPVLLVVLGIAVVMFRPVDQPGTDAPDAPRAPRATTAPDTSPSRPGESDESAIRRVVATYRTAIETKDIDLFRSIRPGLSAAEEASLRESFQRIDSQQVTITIDDIRIDGGLAVAQISRRDVVIVGDRRQTASMRQTLRLEKVASGWIITALGG